MKPILKIKQLTVSDTWSLEAEFVFTGGPKKGAYFALSICQELIRQGLINELLDIQQKGGRLTPEYVIEIFGIHGL